MAVAAQLTPPEKQAAMYIALATWFKDQVGDAASSEKALEAAVAANPTHPAALRALVDGFKLRRDFGRAAACLADAAAVAPNVELRIAYGLDAAELYRLQLSNRDAACEQYRRVLEAEPTNRRAAEALAEIVWESKDWTTFLPLF